MKKMNLIILSIVSTFLVSCGGSSGSGILTSPQIQSFANSIVLNGKIGNFNGSFISQNVQRVENYKDGSQKISTKALRLEVEQKNNQISITVFNGIGTTGVTIVNFDRLAIDPKTQKLSKQDYLFKGLIGEKALEVRNEGEDYDHGPNRPPVPYSQVIQIKKLSATKMSITIEFKNYYVGSSKVNHNIFTGDFDLEN